MSGKTLGTLLKNIGNKTKKAIAIGGAVATLALLPKFGNAQEQIKVFSPKHVTLENPQGIVTGGNISNTTNYEEEFSKLKSTNNDWYGNQVVNPFIRPGYRDKDLKEREYYGSKDVNGNTIINELEDAYLIESGNTSYRGDVNGDGKTNQEDANIIKSVINGELPYAPSDWNYLTPEERIDYFEKIVKLDDTNTYHEGWDCTEYSDKFWLKFAGIENAREIESGEYTYEAFDSLMNLNLENGIFNLPVYKVLTPARTGELHTINAILVGESPLNFEDWYFIEPQIDKRVRPGDFSMGNQEGNLVRIERFCYYYSWVDEKMGYRSMPVMTFEMHNKGPPTIKFKNPYLILSEPDNPVTGIKNPFFLSSNEMRVFPNPLLEGYDLNIENLNSKFNEKGKLFIHDILGRLVYQNNSEPNLENRIIIPSEEFKSLSKGTYIINYVSPSRKGVGKFQKQEPN